MGHESVRHKVEVTEVRFRKDIKSRAELIVAKLD
jgi:hypothetical protein